MAFIASAIVETLLEIDEVSHEVLPDGRLKTVFVTTCLVEDLAKIKTALWALLAPPMQTVDEVNVETLQAGPITKRVRVTVITKPIFGRVRV